MGYGVPAARHPCPRFHSRSLGTTLHAHVARHGRRRHQDRTARWRSHPLLLAASQRTVELLRATERRQAKRQHRLGHARGCCHRARTCRSCRRPSRELSARGDETTWPQRRGGPGAQLAADLRVAVGVRPDRAMGSPACLRSGRRSRGGDRRIAGQRPRWRLRQGSPQPCRRVHGHGDGGRNFGGALSTRTHRCRPTCRRVHGRDDALCQRASTRRDVAR